MKKVRYGAAGALGAIGLLPATGLTAPTAGAATTHAPAANSKSVRLLRAALGNGSCYLDHKHTSIYSLRGYISYNPASGCIGLVLGHRYHSDGKHQWMRIRYYKPGHQGPLSSTFISGTIHTGNDSISFKWSSPLFGAVNSGVSNVCERIVSSGANHTPLTGAVCQTTGYTG